MMHISQLTCHPVNHRVVKNDLIYRQSTFEDKLNPSSSKILTQNEKQNLKDKRLGIIVLNDLHRSKNPKEKKILIK